MLKPPFFKGIADQEKPFLPQFTIFKNVIAW